MAVLVANAVSASATRKHAHPIRMTISPKSDEHGRWCSDPVFTATITNSGAMSVWLDLRGSDGEIVPATYSVCHSGRDRECEGGAHGGSGGWESIEYLRSPEAIRLQRGESVTRLVRLDGACPHAGQVEVTVSVEIPGTEHLDD